VLTGNTKLEDAAHLAAKAQSFRRSLKELGAIARRLERETKAIRELALAIAALTGASPPARRGHMEQRKHSRR